MRSCECVINYEKLSHIHQSQHTHMCARIDILHWDVTYVSHNALICALMQVLHVSVEQGA